MQKSLSDYPKDVLIKIIESLQKKNKLLEEAQTITKAGGWEYDAINDKVYWTQQIYYIYGIDPDVNLDLNVELAKSFVIEEDRKKLDEAFENALSKGESYDIVIRIRNAKDELLWLRTIAHSEIKDNKIIRIYGNLIDITDEVELNSRIVRSEQKYKTLFNYLPDGILVADDKSYYLDANDNICKMLGYDKHELIGAHARDIVASKEQKFIVPALDEILEKHDYKREWEFKRKDGSYFRAEVNVTTLPDETLLAIVRDVSERKEFNDKIKQISNNLRRLLDISQILSSNLDLSSLLQNVVEQAVKIKNLDTGAIYLINEDAVKLSATLPVLHPNFPDELRYAKINDHPHIAKSLKSKSIVIIYDTENAPLSENEKIICQSRGLKSLIYLPIVIKDHPDGVLILGTTKILHKFNKEEMELFKSFSNIAGLAIHNALLYDEILQKEKRLNTAQEIANSGDFIWDIKSGKVTWSDGMYKLLEYEKDEKIDFSKVNNQIHHPDDLKRVEKWLGESIEQKLEVLPSLEYKIIKKGGKIIDVRTVGRIDFENGEPAKVFGSVQDITEQKKTIAKMLQAQREYKTLFESQPNIIVVEDFSPIKNTIDKLKLNGIKNFAEYFNTHLKEVKELASNIRILDINNSSVDLFEAESKDEILNNISLFFDDESLGVIKELFVAAAQGAKVYENDIPIKTLKGNKKYFHLKSIVHPDHILDYKKVILTLSDITEVKKYIDELRESREQIRAMFTKLDIVLEEERKMLARELHDELGQVLTSIKMNLSLLHNSIKNKNYDEEYLLAEMLEMQSNIDMSNKTMRNLIQFLRPEYLDNLGLIIALKHHFEEFQKKNDLNISFTYSDEDLNIKPYIENAVFKVIQEALNNVLKHAKAKNVRVIILDDVDSISVEIDDDGIGINPNDYNKSRSFGILGMKERLSAIKSHLVIESIPGKGTKLRFSVKKE